MRVLCVLGLILEPVTMPKGVNELKDVDAAVLVQSNWNSLSAKCLSLRQKWCW